MGEEKKVKDQLITCCFIIVTIGVQVNEMWYTAVLTILQKTRGW